MFKEIFNRLKIINKNGEYRAKSPKFDRYGLPIIVKTPPMPSCKPCKK